MDHLVNSVVVEMIRNEIAKPILEQQKLKSQMINNVEVKSRELIFTEASIFSDNPA